MALFLLSLVLVGGLTGTWFAYRRDKSISDAASTLQAVLTASAILLAGYWYFVERKHQPHADLSQTVSATGLGESSAAIEVTIAIKNIGSTVLRTSSLDIRLQQMVPAGVNVGEILSLPWNAWPKEDGAHDPLFKDAELQWPTLRWFKSDVVHEIEPGETDTVIATFLVPCSLSVARIATNVAKPRSADLWWKVRSTVDLRETCDSAKGPSK